MKKSSLRTLWRIVLAAICFGATTQAQVGNDNPTSPFGQFNGNSHTGCSYDPYTANATRTIVDMTVAGSVGAYPLQWSRIMNSRFGNMSYYFGGGGGWAHSYLWSATTDEMVNSTPGDYTIYYPDGRAIYFTPSTKGDTVYDGPPGIGDRFQKVQGTGECYLLLSDGGRVQFHQTKSGVSGNFSFTFKPVAIIDPSGLTTTFTVDAYNNITQITEPAGRWLKITYDVPGITAKITRVDAGYSTNTITQSVTYTYSVHTFGYNYTLLDSVNYITDPNSPVATYGYTASNLAYGPPLIGTCNDVHYPGPMKKIRYIYATNADMPTGMTAVYGQIKTEADDDGSQNGIAVTTLTVTGTSTRTETRGDGSHPTRTWNYGSTTQPGFSVPNSYLLGDYTDFKGNHTYLSYDTNSYLNKVKDANSNITSFTRLAFTGALSVLTHPGDSSTIQYFYHDTTTGYFVDHVIDELNHTAVQYTRDTNMRKTRIDYPDSGFETFTYNSFGEVLTHRNTAGGTETYSYDTRGLKQDYRDPYHASGNATFRYQYDSLDRVSGITDALGPSSGDINHTTSFTCDNRARLLTTTHPVDPVDGQRHTVTNVYNADDTLASVTDELLHITSFTYDDYKRLLTKTTPLRFTGDTTPRTTYTYYDAAGTGNDYTHTDSNVTHVKLPSGKIITTVYDGNFWKNSVTVGDGTSDAATTVYGYDYVGDLTSVQSPREQADPTHFPGHTAYTYDSRNRLWKAFDAVGDAPTVYAYDAANRKTSVTRPNGQNITYDSYDNMNRVLQMTVKQTPDPDAVTKYTYYTSGLLHTMQDPHISSSSYNYSYVYDLMGRKTGLTYPPDSGGVQRTESWHYDTANRNDTFTNRNGNVQTLTYDALNRTTNSSWNDSGVTPAVTFVYDVASRTTGINNANATISHHYLNDNLMDIETTTYADNVARPVTYSYDADRNRATLLYPSAAYSFTYNYTNRNQLQNIVNNSGPSTVISYVYDKDGNLTTRTPGNSTSSTYTCDELDRVTTISHALVGTTRTFTYGYDSVSNRTYTQRDGGTGDVFNYDLNDQANGVALNTSLPTPPATPTPAPATITYDPNGNRLTYGVYGGSTDTYAAANNLNQYPSRNSNSAAYDLKGNMTTGFDGSTYTYDAQNRLLTVTKAGVTDTFKYDGLGRQVSRTVTGISIVYNVYDGWNLLAEYASGGTTPSNAYLVGAGGLVNNLTNSNYYYQDGSGSTSHLADAAGNLLEWYRYDLHGTPIVYNPKNVIRSGGSTCGVRHLFTGQEWYREIGLYDLRFRFYSPDSGRFLQPDPIGFRGDPTNLYKYCGNNPVRSIDPSGLLTIQLGISGTVQIGPVAISGNIGIVGDFHGNIGGYSSNFIGGGEGFDASVGPSIQLSTADKITGVSNIFNNVGGEAGLIESDGADFFWSPDWSVVGAGLTVGLGGGGGGYGGVSDTTVFPWGPVLDNSTGPYIGDVNTQLDNPSGDPNLNMAYLNLSEVGGLTNSNWGATPDSPFAGAGPYPGGNANPANPGYVAPGVGPQSNPADSAVGSPPFIVKWR